MSDFLMALSSSFWIIPREGAEALIVITMICSALREVDRAKEIPCVYKNCIAALVIGIALAIVSVFFHNAVLGRAREMSEAIASLIALAMLVYINFTAFQGLKSLANLSLFSIGFLSFISVFREIIETILFYFALFSGSSMQQLGTFAGLILGIVLLSLIVYVYFVASAQWKILSRFLFNVTPFFMFLLALMCIGNAINALQEAGVLGFHNVKWMFNNNYLYIQSSQEYLIAVSVFLMTTGLLFLKQFYRAIVLLKQYIQQK